MDPQHRRYRAFISYSQRDKPIARRLHRALETYRIPSGVGSFAGAERALGRFFRDDEEMGASQSLGTALEGALDDSENLIVVCSPSAAQSKWVDAEVRRFKRRGDAQVFAVVIDGEPHASDPARECFPPALKMKIDRDGRPTGEPDEPRAPDLRREGMARVRAQLAAGLLNLPFDTLWRRDRRRAFYNRMAMTAAGLLVAGVIAGLLYSWNEDQNAFRREAAKGSVSLAQRAAADGQVGQALNVMAPYLSDSNTRALVEEPLSVILGWTPDPYAGIARSDLQPVRLRDATLLLDSKRDAYDVSDIGLSLERLIRSRDGQRLVVVGEQGVVVLDNQTGQRRTQMHNGGVRWVGHAFEAPSGLIVVTGLHIGNTNGSIRPYLFTVSADGKAAQSHPFNSDNDAGVTKTCDALTMLTTDDSGRLHVETRALGAEGLGEPIRPATTQAPGTPAQSGKAILGRLGPSFPTDDAFRNMAKRNPFTAATCHPLASDEGFVAGADIFIEAGKEATVLRGVQVTRLDPILAFESSDRWNPATAPAAGTPAVPAYVPICTEEKPCPVIGGRTDQKFEANPEVMMDGDQVGPAPSPRWLPWAASTLLAREMPLYFEYRVFNAGEWITVCRRRDGRDVCLREGFEGGLPPEMRYLRSADGRYLFWNYAGAVFNLETLQPLTANGSIPRTSGRHFDFEHDRPGLTIAHDGRLVSFLPNANTGRWERSGDERASPRYGILAVGAEGTPTLHTVASLGKRRYLAVRSNGDMALVDAAEGREVWYANAADLGMVLDVQLDPARRHVLLMGKAAWRVFRLPDGLAVSGLLAPPPVLQRSRTLAECQLGDALDVEGKLIAQCGDSAFAWQPKVYAGDLAKRLAQATCATDMMVPALNIVRRCFVDR